MKSIKIFDIIKSDFDSLWNYKIFKNSIEIITPFTTNTMKFISVFITKRNDNYIVSDGGWLVNNLYDIEKNFELDKFINFTSLKKSEYSVESIEDSVNNIYYFKKCKEDNLLSSTVFDMINFILNCVNIYTSQLSKSEIEDEKSKNFRITANDYLSSINRDIKLNKPIEEIGGIKFHAWHFSSNQFTLIMYISGATIYSFQNSIYRAATNFELSSQSKISGYIKNKIPIIDNSVDFYSNNYNKSILLPYLKSKANHDIITWDAREQLKSYFN
jgi:hypothetical protein